MKITFLIGNGFDLNLGLKTSFIDFLEEYKKIDDNDSIIIRSFKNDILKESVLWADAELAFGKYTENFSKKGFSDKDFSYCHRHFCEKLGFYLEKEESKLQHGYSAIASKFHEAMTNISVGLGYEPSSYISYAMHVYGAENIFNFITFNYTRIIDKLVTPVRNRVILGKDNKIINRGGEIVHIHGYTNEDMMLGVNDESQIKDISLFQNEYYKKQLIKPVLNDLTDNGAVTVTKQILGQSDIIYVYGMSIGATDAMWWKYICELLRDRVSLRVIIYSHNKVEHQNVPIDKIMLIETKKDAFLKYGELSENAEQSVRKRIHITTENIFDILRDVSLSEKQIELRKLDAFKEERFKSLENTQPEEKNKINYMQISSEIEAATDKIFKRRTYGDKNLLGEAK